MSVFLLLMGLSTEINSLMQRFWLGHKDNVSKIHWMSRKKLGFSKAKGGLGFYDLRCFNLCDASQAGVASHPKSQQFGLSDLKSKILS